MKPQVLGTRIHFSAKLRFDAAAVADPVWYAGMYAEVSLDLFAPPDATTVGITYGTPGSTRFDVMQLVSPQMGCVYDYKTGQAGLTSAQLLKIAGAWNARFPNVPVIILEMRQYQPLWVE